MESFNTRREKEAAVGYSSLVLHLSLIFLSEFPSCYLVFLSAFLTFGSAVSHINPDSEIIKEGMQDLRNMQRSWEKQTLYGIQH